MLLKFFILAWDDRTYYTLLGTIAFVFVLLAAMSATRAGLNDKVKWLTPLAIGLGLEPLSRLIRLCVEFFNNAPQLPTWLVNSDHDLYYAGQAFVIYGMYMLWRAVNREAYIRKQSDINDKPVESWPPPITLKK